MASFQEVIAQQIIKRFPQDTVFLWENITPPPRQADAPYIRVSMTEITPAPPLLYFRKGDVLFEIAEPIGTGTDYSAKMLDIITKKICYQTVGYLCLLERTIKSRSVSGGYAIMSVAVTFIQYDGQIYG